MTFVFDDGSPDFAGASSAKFYWAALGTPGGSTIDVVATWFDKVGNVIATDHVPGASISVLEPKTQAAAACAAISALK
jgi:hypothetical protein